VCNDLGVECLETLDRPHCELRKPSAQRAKTRKSYEAGEPLEEHIAANKVEVTNAAPSNDQESQHDADHRNGPVVAAQHRPREVAANEIVEADRAKVAREELETGVGTQPRFGELDAKIVLDGSAQIGFSISHRKWPFVMGLKVVCLPTSSHSGGPFCNYKLC